MMHTLLIVPITLPLAAALGVSLLGWRPWTAWAGVASAAGIMIAGGVIASTVLVHGSVQASGFLRADALSAVMVIVIGVVSTLASWSGVFYVKAELERGQTTLPSTRVYGILVNLFIATMTLAVLASNVGVMWVAIEATTVATAFLVGHHRTKGSLEASWKYVVIGSVGIALAFLGTIIVHIAAAHAAPVGDVSLEWTSLMRIAPSLDHQVVRLGMLLVVLGYGTKMGLAPMHTWLPDAHSQAPAPVSALMSGVLLAVAFYAILRFKAIGDIALGPGFLRSTLVVAGILSLTVAASLLIRQRDYKRMLAYSSIEHMGILAIGAAIGSPLAIAAVLLHILGHGLVKTVLFLTSGGILLATGTTDMGRIRGLVTKHGALGVVFATGLLALAGAPPFGLFASELAVISAGFAAGMGWVMALVIALVSVATIAILDHAGHMLLGGWSGPADVEVYTPSSALRLELVPLAAGLVGALTIGVTIVPIRDLLEAASKVVS